jgi:apolipoprotein N-acyltransferase
VLPEAARARVREGAEILVNPSNDSWSRHPKFTGQWFDIVRFRAIETRRYLVRASTSGPSAVIDPWGRVQEKTAIWARGAASGFVLPRRELSLYARIGDASPRVHPQSWRR